MKHFRKIIAATIVAAFALCMLFVPASAASAKGKYGGGGFDPPVTDRKLANANILFVPYGVGTDGIYIGKYFDFPVDVSARVIYRQKSDNSYDVGLQVWKTTSGNISYGSSEGTIKWHSQSQVTVYEIAYTSNKSGKYGTYLPLYSCSADELIFDDNLTFATYVADEYYYNKSVITASVPFYPSDSTSGQVYHIPYPLVSNGENWTYNYGYETDEERQEAIEQSRFDEQNKIIQEGFTQVIQSINDNNIALIDAVHEDVDRIINAGSDMPELDTDNNWMNDSLTKVNGWLTEIGAFESQMKAAEAENSENMAQASQFVNGFFNVVPSAIIAGLTLLLVIIVVVKLVGR